MAGIIHLTLIGFIRSFCANFYTLMRCLEILELRKKEWSGFSATEYGRIRLPLSQEPPCEMYSLHHSIYRDDSLAASAVPGRTRPTSRCARKSSPKGLDRSGLFALSPLSTLSSAGRAAYLLSAIWICHRPVGARCVHAPSRPSAAMSASQRE
jgi:hypothetical protein